MANAYEASSFYRWEVASKPIAIYFSLDLIDRLERDVIESFKAVTKRGSEIGGVLGGRIVPGSHPAVVIDRFEPVECDYSRGPLYLLSDADRERLKQALDRVRNGGGVSVAGFFRSNTRREFALDEEDQALAEEFFSDPNQVFLLVRPFAMKPCTAGFFFEENEHPSEPCYMQFPFKRSELLKNFSQFVMAAPDLPAAEPPATAREEARPPAPPAELKRAEPRPAAGSLRAGVLEMAPTPPPPAIVRTGLRPAAPANGGEQPKAGVLEAAPTPPPPTVVRMGSRPAAPAKDGEQPKARVLEAAPTAPPPAVARMGSRPAVSANGGEQHKAGVREAAPIMRTGVRPTAPANGRERPKAGVGQEDRPPATASSRAGVVEPAPVALAKGEEWAPAPAAPPRTRETASATPHAGRPSLAGQPGLFRRFGWLIAVLVIVLGAGGASYFFARRGAPATGPARAADSSLGLSLESDAGQLVVSWNRNAPFVSRATRATLTINDGDRQEDVDLDLATLRAGSLVYTPLSNDASFRLNVADNTGMSRAETVRRLAGRPSPAVAASSVAPAQPPAGTTDERQPAAVVQPPAPLEQPSPPQVVPSTATAQPARENSLAARLRVAEPAEIPAPPALETRAGALSGSAPNVPGATTAPLPPPPAAAQPRATQPAVKQPASNPPAPAAAPAVAARVGGQVQRARLIKQFPVAYPAAAKNWRLSGVVRVTAVIGKDGRVKKATAISGPEVLRPAAVASVMKWIYTPEILNGEPVAAEAQVDVSFRPGR
jgi:outer membrane biosynthesis protein TonB